ncbi:hypothetical protein NL676_010405 [Syzygium grande]|nr:hypothetical protein NL676_010405 [Syzygium grande]
MEEEDRQDPGEGVCSRGAASEEQFKVLIFQVQDDLKKNQFAEKTIMPLLEIKDKTTIRLEARQAVSARDRASSPGNTTPPP